MKTTIKGAREKDIEKRETGSDDKNKKNYNRERGT